MKLQIMLNIPSIDASFNLLLPDSLPVRQLIPLLVKGVEELSNHSYVSSHEEFLCAASFDRPLDEYGSLKQFGVENGAHLYLI